LYKKSCTNVTAEDYKLVKKHRFKNVDELSGRILTARDLIDQRIIDAAVKPRGGGWGHWLEGASGTVASAESIENETVPIQLAQCWFSGLAISNAKI